MVLENSRDTLGLAKWMDGSDPTGGDRMSPATRRKLENAALLLRVQANGLMQAANFLQYDTTAKAFRDIADTDIQAARAIDDALKECECEYCGKPLPNCVCGAGE